MLFFFYSFMRWFLRLVHIEVCHKSVLETLLLQLHLSGQDIQDHVTSSLQVKMARYVWTEEKMEYFLM